MNVRRVVTGQDATGKSVFVSDEAVTPITVDQPPGTEIHRIWGADSTPALPSDGRPPPQDAFFPPPGGFRWALFMLPPTTHRTVANLDMDAAGRDLGEELPGPAAPIEPAHPGMHATDTVDFAVVLSGEVVLELDDGADVTLRPGDTLVQNGTRHDWHNRGTAPAVVAVALFGATRASSRVGAE